MSDIERFGAHLRGFKSSPFLFVGSGISRRYLGLATWRGLLETMAERTGKPFSFYMTSADGDLMKTASAIAAEFHGVWFSSDEFAGSRERFENQLTQLQGPLKVEIAEYASASIASVPVEGPLHEELELLRNATVAGVITTNYDPLLETLFPDFKTYIGQDELLFADSQSVAEIYKIHGSWERPESIVISSEDFDQFRDRNPYLAAKLLTIFVEHPVIFLGYSISDPHVQEILVSIARVLTTENLSKLQDRLIFVDWDPDQVEPKYTHSTMAIDTFVLPIVTLTVSSFEEVFRVLSELPRQLPAKLLRQLKESIYELVINNEAKSQVVVHEIDSETDFSKVEVVVGVGIAQELASLGYTAIDTPALMIDVLQETSKYDSKKIVHNTLPAVLRAGGNVPIYRYLREAGLLDSEGELLDAESVDELVVRRVSKGAEPMVTVKSGRGRAGRLIEEAGGEFERILKLPVNDAMQCVSLLPVEDVNLEALRTFLLSNRACLHGPTSQPTYWRKLVAYYDYLAFAKSVAAPPKEKRAGRRRRTKTS